MTVSRTKLARLDALLDERGLESVWFARPNSFAWLVGGERRAQSYRHCTPTDASLDGYALISVTATRGGLAASCTRTVAFDEPDWLAERHDAAARVETTALAATQAVGRDGGTAGDVFAGIRAAYDAVGVPDEWREHHQGGAAGFAGREWIATPGARPGSTSRRGTPGTRQSTGPGARTPSSSPTTASRC
jgi:Xaa-Pro aminopeptidase